MAEVVGAAERAILARHRPIVDGVAERVGSERAPMASASAFRFTFDDDVSRDVADISAVARELDVLVRAVHEQSLTLAPPAPDVVLAGTVPPPEEQPAKKPAPGTPAAAAATTATAAAAVHAAVGTLTDAVTRAGVLLEVPAATAARERAEQACQAYRNHWFEESEALFVAAADQAPTEPFMRFGAGLAASRVDARRGAEHLRQAALYLAAFDPPGAAYTAILAAVAAEESDDLPMARAVLIEVLNALDEPCAAISIHLARIGPERGRHIAEALSTDPLMEADLLALGIDGGEAVRKRRTILQEELGRLELISREFRQVDDGPGWIDETDQGPNPSGDILPLVSLEAELWRKLDRCEHDRHQAWQAVTARESAREAKEKDVLANEKSAEADLDHSQAVPVFALGALTAAVVLSGFVAIGLAARWFPSLPWFVVLPIAAAQLAAVVVFSRAFVTTIWPRRRFLQAREAKNDLPMLRWQARRLVQSEFEVRLRYNQANRRAEARRTQIVERRRQVVPARPHFGTDSA